MKLEFLKTLSELAKVKITFAVALTTITGYLLAKGEFDEGMILPAVGIFLLACGSSAINHYQEREQDAKMERTKDRPIPSGRISPAGALLFAFILSAAGSWLLYTGSGMLAMQLGLLALIWYNVIYTPLKKKSAFAVVPGAVIGAIPPLVGWVAGGGSLADPRAMFMAFFFFIWQVPHFWLLMLKYGEEYTKAGFPSITRIYTPPADQEHHLHLDRRHRRIGTHAAGLQCRRILDRHHRAAPLLHLAYQPVHPPGPAKRNNPL
jgi:heme o synthase